MNTCATAQSTVWGINDETFDYPSLKALIKDNRYLVEGSIVFSGVTVPPEPSFLVCAERVADDIQSDAMALYGDCAGDYAASIPKEAIDGLQTMLEAWLMETMGLPSCYGVKDATPYTITATDLSE